MLRDRPTPANPSAYPSAYPSPSPSQVCFEIVEFLLYETLEELTEALGMRHPTTLRVLAKLSQLPPLTQPGAPRAQRPKHRDR